MQQLINAILRYRNALIFAALLSISFIFLNNKSDYHQTQLSQIELWFSGNIFQAQTNVKDYFSLQKENLKLTKENTLLQQKLLQLRQLQQEPVEKLNFQVLQARVIKASFNQARNMLVLNKGAEDGVTPEMGIMSSEGIVGVTKTAVTHYSSGLSLLHKDLRINAKLKNTNAFGSLFWPGDKPNMMKLTDIATINSISIGDTIVTGGMSNYFPENIPIGKVFNFSILPSKRYYEIDVQLFHNFTTTGNVYLIKNPDKEEIESLN